jgi:Tfp pilus assembly protein PilV
MIARLRTERGATLAETLIALAVLAIALTAFLAGLSTGSLATGRADRLSTAHELARSQMEDTKARPFQAPPAVYPSVPAPAGYAVTSTAAAVPGGDASIELVSVAVSKDGAPLFTLEGFKVDR